MNSGLMNGITEQIASAIDIPDSAYQTAAKRYRDLGDWYNRPESKCSRFDPAVYPQGSFRLGTVVRPITSEGEYDLDLGCRLHRGITQKTHTQRQLKELVGADLADYRRARGIFEKQEERRRCWRLRYADNLSFHMDVVPSVPESAERRESIRNAMVIGGTPNELAKSVAELTGAITDNQLPNYDVVSPDWRISNSEGYALWFESRIKLAPAFSQGRALAAGVAGVDALPIYRWKSPLQVAVQLLKRHRDMMFASNADGAPISIIITTLAGNAYKGEGDVASALWRIVSTMEGYINSNTPRVPNPVNPAEDFADKWADPKCRHLNLAANFLRWLAQARNDFEALSQTRTIDQVVELTRTKFGAPLDPSTVRTKIAPHLGGSLLSPAAVPTGLSFPPKPVVPSKPGGFA